MLDLLGSLDMSAPAAPAAPFSGGGETGLLDLMGGAAPPANSNSTGQHYGEGLCRLPHLKEACSVDDLLGDLFGTPSGQEQLPH